MMDINQIKKIYNNEFKDIEKVANALGSAIKIIEEQQNKIGELKSKQN